MNLEVNFIMEYIARLGYAAGKPMDVSFLGAGLDIMNEKLPQNQYSERRS